MLLSAVSVLVVAQSSSEIPEVLTNKPVLHFNRNSFSGFVHTGAPALCAVRAEITGVMIGLYCQYDRHRHFSLPRC